MNYKRILLAIILTCVGIIIFYMMMNNLNWEQEIERLLKFDLQLLLLLILIYIVVVWLRGYRIKYLAKRISNYTIPQSNLLGIIGLQNFFNNIITLRSGEFLYLFLMKKNKIEYQDGMSYLVITRIIDLFCVTILFVFSYIITCLIPFTFANKQFQNASLIVSILIVLSWIFFCMFKRIKFIDLLQRWNFKKAILIKIQDFLIGMFKNFNTVKKTILLVTILISLSIWILEYLIVYLVILHTISLLNISNDVMFIEIIMAQLIIVVAAGIPIYAIAWIGFFEAIFTFSYQTIGFTALNGKIIALHIHAVAIFLFCLFGIIGAIIYFFIKGKNKINDVGHS